MWVIQNVGKTFASDRIHSEMTPINSFSEALKRLIQFPKKVRDTRELTNVLFNYEFLVNRKNPSPSIMIVALDDFCDKEMLILNSIGTSAGFDYKKKLRAEENHYKYLGYGLVHKMEETEFFFSQDSGSRKIVLSSTDCISNLQFITRGGTGILNVMMRSSDLIKLFPLDIINLVKIARNCILASKKDLGALVMNVFVTSLHVYESDEELRDRIMKFMNPSFDQLYERVHGIR